MKKDEFSACLRHSLSTAAPHGRAAVPSAAAQERVPSTWKAAILAAYWDNGHLARCGSAGLHVVCDKVASDPNYHVHVKIITWT